MKYPIILEKISAWICLIGILIFLIGIVSFIKQPKENNLSILKPPSNLIERNIAISKAMHNGQSEYSFITNFTPGIGKINKPEEYKANWQKQMQDNLSNKLNTY